MSALSGIIMLLMTTLIDRFGLTDFQAAGVVGNLMHESDNFTELHEVGQPPMRGGYGWGQWTGPRRRSFLNWCADHDCSWTSEQGNLGYLLEELTGAYRYVIPHMKAAHNIEAATAAFEHYFEQAGVVAMKSRQNRAKAALDLYRSEKKT